MPAVHLPQDPGLVSDYVALAGNIEAAGFDGVWVGEVNGADAAASAALAAAATERADIGMLLNVFTRAPSVLAMSAWTLGQVAPRRAHVVLGVASPLLVERWNGIPYRDLHGRLRDALRFVRVALEGGRVEGRFASFSTDGFALPSPPDHPPQLLVAACGPRALTLAAEEADGVVLNWVVASDLPNIDPLPGDPSRISLVVPICPTAERDEMEQTMRPIVADYLQAPAYAAQQRRLGRGEALEPLWGAWARGDRRAARAAIPGSMLDELVVWGAPDECRRRVRTIEETTGARAIATFFPPVGLDWRRGAGLDS